MKKIVNFWNSLDGHAIVRKREMLLIGLNLFLWGVNLGMLLSPRKKVVVDCNGESEKEIPEEAEKG